MIQQKLTDNNEASDENETEIVLCLQNEWNIIDTFLKNVLD